MLGANVPVPEEVQVPLVALPPIVPPKEADAVPEHSVKVKVSHGRITLTGELQRDQQRTAALEDVTRLFGVTGVSDRTVVKAPKVK